MKVQVWIEVHAVELVDRFSMCGRDVSISHVLPHHRPILTLRQAVVIGMPRTRLGLFHQKLVQQLGHYMIDELAAVIRMKAQDQKRKLFDHLL